MKIKLRKNSPKLLANSVASVYAGAIYYSIIDNKITRERNKMASNYPPGVSGSEPQITGEWPIDVHAPYWAGEACYNDAEGYAVFYGDGEGDFFDGFATMHEAENFAKMLNEHWGIRRCDINEQKWCTICGDYFGETF